MDEKPESKIITIKDHGVLYNGDHPDYFVSDENDNLYKVYNPNGANYVVWYSLMEGAKYEVNYLSQSCSPPLYSFTLVDDTGARHMTLEEATSKSTLIQNNINY